MWLPAAAGLSFAASASPSARRLRLAQRRGVGSLSTLRRPYAPPSSTSWPRLLAQHRYPDPGRCSYAIEDEGGRHIGNVMYYNLREATGEAELGITIGDRRTGVRATAATPCRPW